MPHQCTACGRGFPDGSRQLLGGCPDCGGTTFQFLPDGGRVVASVDDGAGARPVGGAEGQPDSPANGSGGGPGPVGRVATTIGDWVGASGAGDDAAVRDDPVGNDRPAETADREGVLVDAAGAEDDAQAAARGSLPGADRLFDDPKADGPGGGATADGGRRATPEAAPAVDSLAPPDGSAPADPSGAFHDPRPDEDPDAVTGSRPDEGSGAVTDPRPDGASGAVTGSRSGGAPGAGDGSAAGAAPTVEDDPDAVRAELDSQFESIRILEPGRYVINPVELYERDEHVIAVRENGRYVIDVAESRLDGD